MACILKGIDNIFTSEYDKRKAITIHTATNLFFVFERNLLCSPRLTYIMINIFDQKYSLINYNLINLQLQFKKMFTSLICLKCNLFL